MIGIDSNSLSPAANTSLMLNELAHHLAIILNNVMGVNLSGVSRLQKDESVRMRDTPSRNILRNSKHTLATYPQSASPDKHLALFRSRCKFLAYCLYFGIKGHDT